MHSILTFTSITASIVTINITPPATIAADALSYTQTYPSRAHPRPRPPAHAVRADEPA